MMSASKKENCFQRNSFLRERKSKSYSPTILLFSFHLDDDNDEDDMTMIKMMMMTKIMVNLAKSTAKVARHLCIENWVEAGVGIRQNMRHDLCITFVIVVVIVVVIVINNCYQNWFHLQRIGLRHELV